MKTRRRVRPMRWLLVACGMCAWGAAAAWAVPPPRAEAPAGSSRIAVSFGRELGDMPLDGRLLVMLSTDDRGRAAVPDHREPQDPADLRHRRRRPGAGTGGRDRRERAGIPAREPAARAARQVPHPGPAAQVRDVPPRRRARRQAPHGSRRGAALEPGAREPLQHAPGDHDRAGPAGRQPTTIAVKLDKVIPPIPDPPTTKYIKHEKIQSERLTKFWGRPMHLGAHVLLPEGFDEHPEARYPLVIFHGHFPQTFGGFREEPPDPNLKPEYSERFHLQGYNRIVQEHAHQFYKEWTGPELSADGHHRDPARQPLLRRLLRRQLRATSAPTATPSPTS